VARERKRIVREVRDALASSEEPDPLDEVVRHLIHRERFKWLRRQTENALVVHDLVAKGEATNQFGPVILNVEYPGGVSKNAPFPVIGASTLPTRVSSAASE